MEKVANYGVFQSLKKIKILKKTNPECMLNGVMMASVVHALQLKFYICFIANKNVSHILFIIYSCIIMYNILYMLS